MALNPEIALGVRPPQIDLMGDYARLLGIQSQRQQMALQQQSSEALAEQRQAIAEARRAQTDQAQRETDAKSAAQQAIAQIKNGNAEAVLSQLQPEARVLAEGWLNERAKAKQDRQKQIDESRKRTAQLIRGLGYDPVVMETALALHGEDDPEAAEYFKNLPPEQLRQVVDAYATLGEKPGEGYTLTPGSVRYDASGRQVASVPTKQEPPKPELVETVDATGRTVKRWVLPKVGESYVQPAPTAAVGRRVWVVRNGQKVFVPEGAVTSGDEPLTAKGESGLSPSMEANVINRLTTQWTQASGPAKELSRQVALMKTGLDAARRGDLAQGAQAVLVTFQKILDPTSVVRESEYMRSAAGLNLLSRIQGAAEQLTKGGAGVPLADLERFAKLAEEAAEAQRRYLPAIQERIGKTADRYNIPRELVFEDAGAAGGGPKVGDVKTFPNGKRGRWDGVGWEQID